MRLATLSASVVLVLAAVVPVAAEEPEPAVDLAALAATPAATPGPQAGGCGWPDLAAALVPEPVEAAVSGSCTATCHVGSVTCTGSSCSAVDSNCPSYSGYCWSNAEGYKYCPVCPPCHTVDCGCEGLPCVKNSQCGTCFGYQCVCVGPTGNKHCICP